LKAFEYEKQNPITKAQEQIINYAFNNPVGLTRKKLLNVIAIPEFIPEEYLKKYYAMVDTLHRATQDEIWKSQDDIA
jgi:hypothetical protein